MKSGGRDAAALFYCSRAAGSLKALSARSPFPQVRERARSTPDKPEKKSRDIQLADNRKAFFDYSIEDKLEAGVSLTGTEIKSLRAGRVNLRDGYARIEKGEAWLRGVHISPWDHTGLENHESTRP